MATWATFLYLGVRGGRPRSIVWAVIYLSLFLSGIAVNQVGNDADPTLGAIAATLWVVAWAGGIVHYRLIDEEARARLAEWRPRNERARQVLRQRSDAQALAERDPQLARGIGIGRPVSSPDSFGGVVDINNATHDELATLPGLDDAFLNRIVQARQEIGPFSSVFDLGLRY